MIHRPLMCTPWLLAAPFAWGLNTNRMLSTHFLVCAWTLLPILCVQVHKIAILDIRLLNGDRNDANILVRRSVAGNSCSGGGGGSSSHYHRSHSDAKGNGRRNGSVRVHCTRWPLHCSCSIVRKHVLLHTVTLTHCRRSLADPASSSIR